jgi:uncharacterized protein with PIN domain
MNQRLHEAMERRFIVDRMLGRLARTLRLLGYDTLYSPAMTSAQLLETARRDDRLVLTRGHIQERFPSLPNVYSVASDNPPEQLREVVEHFGLDASAGLWTRCTLCNAQIQKVEKQAVASLVEPKVYEIYKEFYRCSGCGHIYWCGSHVERILKNLSRVLHEKP